MCVWVSPGPDCRTRGLWPECQALVTCCFLQGGWGEVAGSGVGVKEREAVRNRWKSEAGKGIDGRA